jgi:hypothetical protein
MAILASGSIQAMIVDSILAHQVMFYEAQGQVGRWVDGRADVSARKG